MKKITFPFTKLIQNNRIFLIYTILVMILIHFMLNGMWESYYTFDEWKAVGAINVNGTLGFLKLFTPLEILSGKGRALALLIGSMTIRFAPFQVYPFAATAYLFHFINALLLYAIINKFSKSKLISFFGGLFFVAGSSASMVFAWLGATYENLLAIFFSFLSVLIYINLPTSDKVRQSRLIILSWIFVLIAYYFKEPSIILVVFLPWLYWITHQKEKNGIVRTIKRHIPLIIFFFGIGIARLLTHFYIHGNPTFAQQPNPSYSRILFHLAYYPLTTLAQFFIPYDFMIRLSGLFFNLNYSGVSFAFTEAGQSVLRYFIIADYLSFIISTFLLIYIYLVLRPVKTYRVLLSFALIYYILQFIPIAFYDRSKGSAYFDSEFYYVLLPSAAIIFGLLLDSVKTYLSKVLHPSILASSIVIIIGLGFIYKQALVMRRNVSGASVYAQRSKNALEQFVKVQPSLPDKPIIFLSGNTEYFWLPRQYIPIEPNPGYVLMVLYYKTGKIPGELILESYNFNQGEGYRGIGNKAYGYFNNKEDLLKLFENNSNLSLNQVVGFFYDGATNKLSSNTEEIHKFLWDKLNYNNQYLR